VEISVVGARIIFMIICRIFQFLHLQLNKDYELQIARILTKIII